MQHLSDSELLEHLDNINTKPQRRVAESHILRCPQCEKRLTELSALVSAMRRAPTPEFKENLRQRMHRQMRAPAPTPASPRSVRRNRRPFSRTFWLSSVAAAAILFVAVFAQLGSNWAPEDNLWGLLGSQSRPDTDVARYEFTVLVDDVLTAMTTLLQLGQLHENITLDAAPDVHTGNSDMNDSTIQITGESARVNRLLRHARDSDILPRNIALPESGGQEAIVVLTFSQYGGDER